MKYIALLRGINVGGKHMIKMETLRAGLTDLGFENVKTYINSGNIVFETRKSSDNKLEKTIHDAINKQFGFDISVMVRSMSDMEEIVRENPFDGQFKDDKHLHVFFLADELRKDQLALLNSINNENEMIRARGRTIYCLFKISIVDSVLGKGFIDKKLRVPATARNWRTVKKLAEI